MRGLMPGYAWAKAGLARGGVQDHLFPPARNLQKETIRQCANAPHKHTRESRIPLCLHRTERADNFESVSKNPFSGLGSQGQTELQPGDIESPPAKAGLAELEMAEIPAREVADIAPVDVQAYPAEATASLMSSGHVAALEADYSIVNAQPVGELHEPQQVPIAQGADTCSDPGPLQPFPAAIQTRFKVVSKYRFG